MSSCTLNTTQKLELLRAAISHPFTSKSSFLSQLTSQFPSLNSQDIQHFFDDLVDFDALTPANESSSPVEEVKDSNENPAENKIIEEENSFMDVTVSLPPSSPVLLESAKTTTPSSPSRPHSAPPSSPTLSKPSAPAPTPSPPLVVPVRTPSGRTLRSNSTVNTSEPRRLRSNPNKLT